MFSKLKNILGNQKTTSTPKSKKKSSPTTSKQASVPSGPTRHPQYEIQWEKLMELYKTIQINPWNSNVEGALKKILDSLQKYTISDYLASTYSKERLDEYKEYAIKQFEAMGTINRERAKSLIGLADEEMHKTIYECLFLCNVNPIGSPPFELSDTQGFDAKGNPILEKHVYPVFTENALSGVAGIDRFLPKEIIEGSTEKNIQGMNRFLESEYSELVSKSGPSSHYSIQGMTTIGSLGGIGHKPDSDMDLQVIFNTNPTYDYRWNDADFFLALFQIILDRLRHSFFENYLPDEKRRELREKVVEKLKEDYWESLNEDERAIIKEIFPSSYQTRLNVEIWIKFNELPPPEQAKLLRKQMALLLKEFPYMETHVHELKACFPLLKSLSEEQTIAEWFPYSAETLTRDKMGGWLTKFYQEQYLGAKGTKQVLQFRAKKKGLSLSSVKGNTQISLLLEHLSEVKQRPVIIKAYLIHTAEHISLIHKDRMNEILALLRKQFDPQNQFLKEDLQQELQFTVTRGFRARMVNLIKLNSDLEAIKNEAKSEYALHKKIQMTEMYLTRKYPTTEVHLFTNILRNQRQGQHTPFLVSPEGSMAYSVMLNDFLLNPAIVLAGVSPMPFDLPPDLKVMLSTGILPASEWNLSQSKEEGSESFSCQQLVDWGETQIPREKLWSHAIPIYLRESEKVSHRNLPKALLNCWWLEMLCCKEKTAVPTSLTRLLWDPDERYFVKNKLEGKQINNIQKIEKEFPLLVRDPWWLKFTEMLPRFEEPKTQEQIIFCFSQHVRLTDIIDFNNEAKPIYLDMKKTKWRTKAMVSFYDLFIPEQQDRINLMKFAQGRDDIGNELEKDLKEAFLASMNRTEQKLIGIGNSKALKAIMGHLKKQASASFPATEIENKVKTYLKEITPKLVIADEKVLEKAKTDEPLSSMETRQYEELQKDRKQMRQILEGLVAYCVKMKLKTSSQVLAKYILDTRVKMAGDPLENVIFKYHFERNFKRKPYQVILPISKSLSIPRKKIMLAFEPTEDNWIFKSILSKQDARGSSGESEMAMFTDALVEGLARCVFSGYVGFTSKNLTSFEKPAASHKSNVANTPVTHQDIQDLAFEVYNFFPRSPVRPQELLENIHYITNIFMICGVNYPGSVALIIRDNFGDHFVIDFDISQIKVKIPSKHLLTNDESFPRFFLQLHSKECREMFEESIEKLKIPLDQKYQPQFKVWANFGGFDLTIAPKFYRIYVNGIANALWPNEIIGTPKQKVARKLEKSLDQMGKDAIQKYQRIEAEKKALIEKAHQKNAIRARSYMDRKRNELGL